MRVKCLAQEHNTMSPAGFKPGLHAPESSALITRPPRLPHVTLNADVNVFNLIDSSVEMTDL